MKSEKRKRFRFSGAMSKHKRKFDRLTDEQRKLVEDNIALVPYMYTKLLPIIPNHISHDDVKSNGYIGLMRAAQEYDITGQTKFSTFACAGIRMYMMQVLNDIEHRYNVKLKTFTDLKPESYDAEADEWAVNTLLGTEDNAYDEIEVREIYREIYEKAQLIDSERELVARMLMGYTCKEVAIEQNVSHQAMDFRKQRAFRKLREAGQDIYEKAFEIRRDKQETIREKRKRVTAHEGTKYHK